MGDRISDLQERIAAAARRAGRAPEEVELVAVSKKFGPETVREAAEHGLRVFGENKVQEAYAKIPECPGGLSWHLVGHLQSNKIRPALELFDVIHSVDSVKLLRGLERVAEETGHRVRACLQVNVSGEAAKFGLAPEALPEALEAARECPHIEIAGLMTMPPFTREPEGAREHFVHLRELRDRCADEWDMPVDGLSMGMSRDFEIAIEEGATWIRIGTDIFGPRR